MQKEKIISFFEELQFIEDTHTYSVKGEKLKYSVSNVVQKYKPKFERDAISQAMSFSSSKTQEEILKGWDDTAKIACDLGHRVHKFGELYPYDNTIIPKDGFERAVVSFWKEIPNHLQLVFCEIMMYHKKLMYAGTADVLLYDPKRKGFIIVDYKTNKDLFKNYKGQTLLRPFSNLLSTPFNGYQIQLSLYQILLEQVGIKVVDRIIVWLRPDGHYEMYKTENLTSKLKDYA